MGLDLIMLILLRQVRFGLVVSQQQVAQVVGLQFGLSQEAVKSVFKKHGDEMIWIANWKRV